MAEQNRRRRFEEAALPHLDAAYNLARWLTHSDVDAEDVVQEAYLRAYSYFDGFRGDNNRAWLLTIVRNTCYRWLAKNRPAGTSPLLAGTGEGPEADEQDAQIANDRDPEILLIQQRDAELLNELIAELPPTFREALVLRELEELSYREISDILEVPIGTVMSRLARARGLLKQAWHSRAKRGTRHGL